MYPKNRRSPESCLVRVKVSRYSLQLVFTHEGKRHYISPGLADTPLNRMRVQEKAFEIQRDIEYGEFDGTYAKYKIALTQAAPEPAAPEMTLTELWVKYMEYKVPNASPKTIDGTYEPVLAHLNRFRVDGLKDPLRFRMGLLGVTTQSQAKRSLMQLSAACKWGMKHGLVERNPFEGMYKELEATKPDPPMAFTVEERDRIISAFEHDSLSGIDYRHYAAFVKFLFWSGCRPCEAIGESNFASRAWKKVLTGLELEYKDGIKMTPYNCRDTFITLQAVQGNSSTTISFGTLRERSVGGQLK
jgi:integrase